MEMEMEIHTREKKKTRHSTSIIANINADSWSKREQTRTKKVCNFLTLNHYSCRTAHTFVRKVRDQKQYSAKEKTTEEKKKARNDNLCWHLLNVPRPWWEIIICDLCAMLTMWWSAAVSVTVTVGSVKYQKVHIYYVLSLLTLKNSHSFGHLSWFAKTSRNTK